MKYTKRLFYIVSTLCILCAVSCSSNSDEQETPSNNNNVSPQCAVTGGVDIITYCSAHIQASYSIPENLPSNYNWAKEWDLGICYGKDKNISNESADKCYIIKNGQAESNVYSNGSGYAYVNDTTYWSVVLDRLESNTTYYYCTFNTIYGKTYYGQVKSFTTKPLTKAVDLGLSVKWATYNVGASSPEEIGDYYAWGEIDTKSEYSYSNYECWNIDYEISGTEYDVAHVKWGGSWRMPTKVEMEELINSCTWKYTLCNGVEGALAIGKNGNSIFLPICGVLFKTYRLKWGEYWTSTKDDGEYTSPYKLQFLGDNILYSISDVSISDSYGYWGQCVRPVCD